MASLRPYTRAFLSVGIVMTTLFAGSSVAHAAGWVPLTSPTTSDLSSVSCSSSSHCLAVGKSGVVVYTTNGKTWSLGSSGITTTLSDSFSYGSVESFAVGTGGHILKSTDGGVTWTSLTSGTTEDLNAVTFGTSSIGWVAGNSGTILKTTDGGTTWAVITVLGTTINDITSTTASTVWAVGKDGAAFLSTNGGTSWSTVSYPMTPNDVLAVAGYNSTDAFIVGENAFFASTTNAGVTWTYHAITGFVSGEHAVDLVWVEGTGGLVVGNLGTVVSIGNDRSTFTLETKSSSLPAFGGISIPSTSSQYAVGTSGAIGLYDMTGPSAPGSLALTSGSSATNDTTPSLTWGAASDSEASVASYQIQVDSGSWNSVGNVLTASLTTALSSGSHTVSVRGVDTANNTGTSRSATFTVDTAAPTVDVVSPTSATAGTAMTFSASGSDATSGISSCSLLVNGTSVGAMTYSSTLAKYALSYSFPSSGSYSVQMSCTDVAGNTASGSAVTVTVSGTSSSDTTVPTVGQISQTTATKNAALTLSATVSDNVALSSCSLYTNSSYVGAMSVSGSTASYSSYIFTSTGSFTAYVTCTDSSGNIGTGSSQTITVSSDTTAPTVGQITQTTATKNAVTTLSATESDSVGVSSCSLYVGGSYIGVMTLSSGTASYSYTFTSTGSYSAYVTCVDASGNTGTGSSQTVTVSTDTSAPSVGQISQTTATQNVATTLSATVTDNVGVSSCSLYVNSSYVGPLSISSSTASYSYTFGSTGSYSAYITCLDSVANVGIGASQTITVSAASTAEASKHDLIKLACTNSEVNDPCTAVYYYGDDGYRHAFPNSNVYYTWYTNFDSVKIVSSSFMSSLTLGHNVTYHPGTKMVKFTTVNTVYAVGTAGELRAIQSEELATSLYGSTWNQQIDDISDAFHGNYAFGEIIDTTSDFSPSTVKAGSTSIEDVI